MWLELRISRARGTGFTTKPARWPCRAYSKRAQLEAITLPGSCCRNSGEKLLVDVMKKRLTGGRAEVTRTCKGLDAEGKEKAGEKGG